MFALWNSYKQVNIIRCDFSELCIYYIYTYKVEPLKPFFFSKIYFHIFFSMLFYFIYFQCILKHKHDFGISCYREWWEQYLGPAWLVFLYSSGPSGRSVAAQLGPHHFQFTTKFNDTKHHHAIHALSSCKEKKKEKKRENNQREWRRAWSFLFLFGR